MDSPSNFYPRLSIVELNKLVHWKYNVLDLSITNIVLVPFWNFLLNYIPGFISPNLLTLCGLVVSLSVWAITEYLFVSIPLIITLYFISSTLDGLDGKLARKIDNSTPFGELFDHSVDIITLFVVTRITMIIFGAGEIELTPVYIVVGYAFCYSHYIAYIRGYVTLERFSGPNEMLLVVILSYVTNSYCNFAVYLPLDIIHLFAVYFSVVIFLAMCYKIDEESKEYYRIDLPISRLTGFFVMISIFSLQLDISAIQIVCMFVIINAELITTKMADTNFRHNVILCCAVCLIGKWVAIATTIYVMVSILGQIKHHLQIPFLAVFNYYDYLVANRKIY